MFSRAGRGVEIRGRLGLHRPMARPNFLETLRGSEERSWNERTFALIATFNDMPIEQPYSFQFLETATETLRAVAHPHRLLIIEMLFRQKTMNVTEVYEQLEIEQAVASHHLRILKDRGIVQVRRDGKNSNYSLTTDEYHKILEVLGNVV